MTIFENLEKISNDYKSDVDALSADYEAEARHDERYNDTIRAERRKERAPIYDAKITALADAAANRAEKEIDKLRAELQKYITTSSDPNALQTLQVLLSSGRELTGAEIRAFAAVGGYPILRLLEAPSGGQIHAPRAEGLEGDLHDLSGHFKRLSAYRAGMGDTNLSRPYGQSGDVGSTIQAGQLARFHEKLADMESRWADVLKEG